MYKHFFPCNLDIPLHHVAYVPSVSNQAKSINLQYDDTNRVEMQPSTFNSFFTLTGLFVGGPHRWSDH